MKNKKQDKKPNLREEYVRVGKEAALESKRMRVETESATVDAAYDEDATQETAGWNKLTSKELQDDWENLRRYAKVHFPEGSKFANLSPRNKLFGVAYGLGWPVAKIAKASGMRPTTLYDWVKRPDIMLFVEEFKIKEGKKDVMDKFADLEFKAVNFIDDLLSDPDNSDSVRRLKMDAAKWVFERNRGKSAQPIEHRGEAMKKIWEQLGQVSLNMTEKEEEEIFTIN